MDAHILDIIMEYRQLLSSLCACRQSTLSSGFWRLASSEFRKQACAFDHGSPVSGHWSRNQPGAIGVYHKSHIPYYWACLLVIGNLAPAINPYST